MHGSDFAPAWWANECAFPLATNSAATISIHLSHDQRITNFDAFNSARSKKYQVLAGMASDQMT